MSRGDAVRYLEIDEAIAAARRVVVRGYDSFQGRRERRTIRNTPVTQVVFVGSVPSRQRLADVRPLRRLAARRCGRSAALWAWAVVFTQANSVMCCESIITFVVGTRRGTYVY